MKKMWCIYTVKYYTAIKKKEREMLPLAMTWMTLDNFMLNKTIQMGKDKKHLISLISEIKTKKQHIKKI